MSIQDMEDLKQQYLDEMKNLINGKDYQPLFDLRRKILSSEFNPTHNEDLDSTPKDVHFDVESYLLESLVNHDTLMASPPKIDFLLDEFAGELTSLQSTPLGIDNINLDPEDIPVDVPNILPIHPALQLDFNFIPSNDLGSDLDGSSPSGDRNKIYDPGICIEVESTGILAPLSPVIDTLPTFSSENEDKVFNHGVLASKEKSPSSPSHRGLKASKDCPDFEASRARGFCPSITRASNPQLHFGNPIS
ncbi:hypothetical protein Tco_1556889 [Tanacetum coccineum]